MKNSCIFMEVVISYMQISVLIFVGQSRLLQEASSKIYIYMTYDPSIQKWRLKCRMYQNTGR